MKVFYSSFLVLLSLIICSNDVISQVAKLKTFPDIPGRDSSDHYTCRVREVSSDEWKSAFVLQTMSKPGVTKEDQQTTTKYTEALAGWTASWISFEFSGTSVVVEISKNNGEPIEKAMVRPVGHASVAEIIDGKAYVTFDKQANVNVDIDGQMEDVYTGMGYNGPPVHTISIFANPVYHVPDTTNPNVYALEPGEAIPSRTGWDTLFFKPGIHEIGVPHSIENNETYYIPGDAVVHGTLRSSWGTENIKVYGSGTLSGERITRTVYGDENAKPINGSGQSARFEGIVIPDPAHHTVIYDNSSNSPQYVNIFDNLKILGWRVNGDGIHTFKNGEVVNCFIRTQDDATYYSKTVKIHNSVFWNDWNGAVVRIVKGDEIEGTSCFKDNVVIYHRANWHYWDGGRVIAFRDAGPGKTIKNVLVKNILIEDPLPAFPPFWFTMDPEGDGTLQQVMENVRIENVHQEHPGVPGNQDSQFGKPRNTILGLNAKNKYSNIDFKSCYYNGKLLESFEDGNFLINEFIENITFTDTSTLEVNLISETGGTVSGSGTYQNGDEVSIKAFTNLGYRFTGWTTNEGDTISYDPLYTFIINENVELTANFAWLENSSNVVFAINCGGPPYEASDGTLYSTDHNFINGSIYYQVSPIANTVDDELYHTERFGNSFGYRIPIENGNYELSLHFAEIFFSSPGSRVFNVDIEGSALVTDLDIYAEAGSNYAYVLTYPVTISDGELNIDFTASTNNAKISAIKVAIPSEKDLFKLSTNALNGSISLIPEGGNYDSLQTVILTANGDPGYRFTGWSDALTGTSNPESIIIDGDKTVTANFEALPSYQLETNATNGRIELDPDGGTYFEGDTVFLTAIPDYGYKFTAWSDDLSGTTNPVSIVMSENKIVTASFEVVPFYTLTTHIENGTLSLDPPGGEYAEGTEVSLSVTADDLYRFVSWSGDITNSANPVKIIMDSDKELTAEISKYLSSLTINSSNGSISVTPEGDVFNLNSAVILTAIPDDGYEFSNWEGDLSGTANPTSIIMDTDKNITAVFNFISGINDFSVTSPAKTALAQNYPNPFYVKTTIPYSLSETAHVKLSVYNSMGQAVITLVDKNQDAGYYTVDLYPRDKNGSWLPSGIYFVQLITDNQTVQTKKFVFRK